MLKFHEITENIFLIFTVNFFIRIYVTMLFIQIIKELM